MILNAYFGEKVIPTEIALLITAVLIGGSMAISLIKTRGTTAEQAPAEVKAWWVPGSPAKDKKPKESLVITPAKHHALKFLAL